MQVSNTEPSSGIRKLSGADGFGGDIVVTAQKREQSINDVGMSISAIGGEALADRGITDPADMMKVVPGFTFQETAIGNPVYTLRGVGFIEQSYSSAPTVSVYVNEIPLPFAVMGRDVAFDLERLEVLKGPQGTLTRPACVQLHRRQAYKPAGNRSGSELWQVRQFCRQRFCKRSDFREH